MKQKQNHGHRKQIDVCQGGEGGKGRSGRLGLPDANWYIQNVRTTRSHCIAQGAIFRPRGATPLPRSRAEAGRTPRPRGGSQEELSHFRSQGQQPKGVIPHPRSGAVAKSARLRQGRSSKRGYPRLRSGMVAWRSCPTPEARGSGRKERPHTQGAMAARCQKA